MQRYTFPVLGEGLSVNVPDRPEDLDAFREWVTRQANAGATVAVDTETKGLKILSGDPDYVRLVQFGNALEAWNIPTELGPEFKDAARRAILQLPSVVGHNWASFDALALHAHLGIDYDVLCRKATDTMLLAKLRDPRKQMEGGIGASLKPLSDHYVDPTASDTQGDLTSVFRGLGLTKATGWAGIDLFHPTYQSYAGGDVILTSRLRPKLTADLDRLGVPQRLRDYEGEIARICGHMQLTGMVLDQDYTRELSGRLADEAAEYAAKATRYGVEKIGSPKQLAEAFVGMGEELKERTANGALKVDKNVLCRLADIDTRKGKRLGKRTPNPLAEAVIRAKRAAKWKTAYADNFLDAVDINGRIHPNIQTMAARTGRMSVTNPAVQTLPSRDWMIRRALLADEGHVIVPCDFASVEMRVLAALADVKRMKEAIAAGKDLNDFTAELVYGPDFTEDERSICKGVGYGTVFGGGEDAIAAMTGAPKEAVAHAQSMYHRLYPEIRRAGNRWQREAFSNGMVVTSITGRRMPLDRDRTYAATNYQVQSAARDCLGQSLIHMDKAGLLPLLRLAVHDEVIVSAPKDQAHDIAREIEKCMTFQLRGVQLNAKAKVGGRSWGHSYMDEETRRRDPLGF